MSDRAVFSPPSRPSTTAPAERRSRLRRGDQSGAAVVEFALVVPVFLLVLYGLIFFGMLLANKQAITNAAADAARSSVGAVAGPAGGGPAGETQDQAVIRVAKAAILSHLGSVYDSPDPTVNFCTGAAGPKCITVIVQRNAPPVPPAPGLGIVWSSAKHLSSTAVVQYTA